MPARRLWRIFLAAALLVATQASLQHPLEHLQQGRGAPAAALASAGDSHPFEPLHAQQCDVCVVAASLGAAAPSASLFKLSVPGSAFAAARTESVFIAAFSPLFHSQAPPALL
jgi:hypothetical protein